MTLEQRKYLADVLFSVSCIEEFIGEDKKFEQYNESKLLQAAVERHIEIIGEAIKHLLETDTLIPITNARRIVNTRNKIAHGYDEIDNAEIWNIVINHLPILKKESEYLLNS